MKANARGLYEELKTEAETGGYHLNPDESFTLELVEGLVTNLDRYGYLACPCRLADGERLADLDIICPCDYRDADLAEYGTCYCGLYVSGDKLTGEPAEPIPERRPEAPTERPQYKTRAVEKNGVGVWRCRVCGYLCARPEPPSKCPICKADKDRFEPFEFA
ncbi:MAG: ferredoxin:glutaredoxin reductase [Candidatus Coatesbacteria bacterium]|nr:MAG: ferredoxin:glutaredoxin reductase [Candidatus Coatesbacteria bacterium]